MKLLNAFSLNMLASCPADVHVEGITAEKAVELLRVNCESCVGHADTAAVFASELGLDVPANRCTITLQKGDRVVVGQYRGPRLAEGATQLPEDATIQWLFVKVE